MSDPAPPPETPIPTLSPDLHSPPWSPTYDFYKTVDYTGGIVNMTIRAFDMTKTEDSETAFIVVPLVVAVLLLGFMCFCCCTKEKRQIREEAQALEEMKKVQDEGFDAPQTLTKEERRRLRKLEREKQREAERAKIETDEPTENLGETMDEEAGLHVHDGLAEAPEGEGLEGDVPPQVDDVLGDDPAPAIDEVDDQEIEYRMDPADGQHYDYQSFIEAYGVEDGDTRWHQNAHTAEMVRVSQLNDLY
eukprot:TRINITY_DN18619_c0_g1_i1.p2 TRINITY_DN18619_c0_g1~~TRINITY_DN18619_c0_g1_i1.p2  ORF type:complete len:247 (+),score=107.86 TRINITY_DN18619_c0_g1_i1:187-927(+)